MLKSHRISSLYIRSSNITSDIFDSALKGYDVPISFTSMRHSSLWYRSYDNLGLNIQSYDLRASLHALLRGLHYDGTSISITRVEPWN